MLRLGRNVVVVVLLTLTLACEASAESAPWRGAPVITGKAGEQLCGKHREPLQRATVFGPGGCICVLIQPSKKMVWQLARSPNALPFGVHRKADVLYSRPVDARYCVRCDEEVERATKK